MNLWRDIEDIRHSRWETELPPDDAYMRLWLLESDLKSLRIALTDYFNAKNEVNTTFAAMADSRVTETGATLFPKEAWARMFHHAKVFVVCMRRFGRLLEAAKAHKGDYTPDIGETI